MSDIEYSKDEPDRWSKLQAENAKLRAGLEDVIETLEAMDLYVDNPLYERTRALLEE